MGEIVLTDQQKAVVDNRGGALLVSAAAGSGKTKVLIDRVLKRVEEDGCDVDQFLMITFTQAAAAELRGKLIGSLSERLAQTPENRHLQRQMTRVYLAQISTVHAFCGGLLREYAHLVDLAPDFRVCDEQEATFLRQRAMETVLEEAYATIGKDAQVAAALNSFGSGRNDKALPELIFRVFTSLQCYPDPEVRLQDLRRSLELTELTDVGQTVWGAYLMEEFATTLEDGRTALRGALEEIRAQEALQAYLPTFTENLELLDRLGAETTWEGIRSVTLDFGRLKAIRNCSVPEIQARVQAARKKVVNDLRQAQSVFAIPSAEAMEDLRRNSEALHGLLTLAWRFDAAYGREKDSRRVVDYNDLEHKSLRLLRHRDGTPTAAAREIGKRYVEIMVDEYQDTNAVQDAIFCALSPTGQNLFFVGDVKQSIYRFRLADPTIFLEKYKKFADYTQAVPGEARKILLSENFRSHGDVLAAANDVFRLTMTERVGGLNYGPDEALRDGLKMNALDSPAVELHCITMEGVPQKPPRSRSEIEAEFVARRIHTMLEQQETIPDGKTTRFIRPEDIVILVRSLSGKAEDYVRALARYDIRCVSGSENIFISEEIILIDALLQVIDNPHQDIPLVSVLISPLFQTAPDVLARARAADRKGDIFTAISTQPEMEGFVTFLRQMRELAQTASLRRLLDTLEERLYLRAVFGAMEGGAQRVRNLERFFALADGYEKGERYGLHGFLTYISALKEKGVATEDAPAAGAVRMMTIHKSKGLEFPVVFLADLCKQFNQEDSKAPLLVDTQLGLGASGYDAVRRLSYPTVARQAISHRIRRENASEEMRVLYVAMTRPKYRLIMTCCAANLEGKLANIARDLTVPASNALIESGNSLGHWVLMAAMCRTEAGALFQAADTPEERRVSDRPWKITWQNGGDFLPSVQVAGKTEHAAKAQTQMKFLPLPRLHPAAEKTPSKLTATQLKGRALDEEAAEQTVQPPQLNFRQPQFTAQRALTPTERGTALHLAMQYLNYEACGDLPGVEQELQRLVEEKFLTEQQCQAVAPQKILNFFRSPLGRRLLDAQDLVREFKFSVLEDGAILDPALAGEEILLQGVTDCALRELDGLTIVDFKTDRVRPGEERQRAEYYRGQLDAYSRALCKVFDCPVKERILYFFATDSAVEI